MSDARAPRPSRIRRFAIASALVLLSLCLAEAAARGLYAAFGRPYSAQVCRTQLGTWTNALGAKVPLPGGAGLGLRGVGEGIVAQPYLGWAASDIETSFTENDAYFASELARENYDVFVLGGSVAQGFGIEGDDRLVARLALDPRLAGRRIRVHDYARAAYKAPQHQITLAYALSLGHEPDAVILIDGFNEVAIGWSNASSNANPIYPALGQWAAVSTDLRSDAELVDLLHAMRADRLAALRFVERSAEYGLWRSCVLGAIVQARAKALLARYHEDYRRVFDHLERGPGEAQVRGPAFDRNVGPAFDAIVRIWEQGSRMIDAICDAREIPYLHVLQPTLHDAGAKPLTAKELEHSGMPPAWIEGVHTGYPMLRLAGARMRADGIDFLDASGVFRDVREDLYYDGCHFVTRGHELLADEIAKRLLESIEAER